MNTDYYSLLELHISSTTEEIKKKYFHLAKVYHPDVAGDKPENRERFKMINEAYSILIDPQKRQEYDDSLRKKNQGASSVLIHERDKKSASLAFTQAKECMREGRYDKAVLLLKSAVKLNPENPAYHSWHGFCLAMSNSRLHEARDECKKAVQMEFYNADYHANLGFVYFKVGLKSMAVKHFKDALKWDPENSIARKFMRQADGGKYDREGPIDRMMAKIKGIFSAA
ncbi:MAG: DnaJ domain-containing protein [Candidatus Krumholzibacteriota bacterium]|nr:DnaJ domain-containing protein [Candidatus Krumholzibacteriota bacterium]